MKNKTYIKTAILSLMGGLVLLSSSCLKDSHYVDYLADAPLAEFPLAEYNPYQAGGSDGAYQAVSFPATNTTDTITVAVRVAAPKPLTSATVFTISGTDLTGLSNYNTANGTTFQALPAADFVIVGGSQVTVPANQTTALFKVLIQNSAIDAAGTYVLPLTIENAGSVQIALPEKYLLYNLSN